MNNTPKPIRMVLDTDTFNEVDDQFALAYACLSPEQVTLEACYAAPFLNDRSTGPADGMEKSFAEIHEVLKLLGQDLNGQVFRGADRFLEDVNKPIESEAVYDLISRAKASTEDDPLYVVGIAAATNLASALLIDPSIKSTVKYVWLGGQPLSWYSAREFNLYQNVIASQVLFDSGVDLTLVPCTNVAQHFNISIADIEKYLNPDSKLCRFLSERFITYLQERNHMSKPLWDVAAIAYVVNPNWVPRDVVPTPILTTDFKWLPRKNSTAKMQIANMVYRDLIFGDMCAKLNRVP